MINLLLATSYSVHSCIWLYLTLSHLDLKNKKKILCFPSLLPAICERGGGRHKSVRESGDRCFSPLLLLKTCPTLGLSLPSAILSKQWHVGLYYSTPSFPRLPWDPSTNSAQIFFKTEIPQLFPSEGEIRYWEWKCMCVGRWSPFCSWGEISLCYCYNGHSMRLQLYYL